MGSIYLLIYKQYDIIACKHYKFSEVGFRVTFQVPSEGMHENLFLVVTVRVVSGLLMSVFSSCINHSVRMYFLLPVTSSN